MKLQLSQAINHSLDYLLSVQQPDGSFTSFSSNDEQNFSNATTQNNTFLNSFILLQLCDLPDTEKNKKIKKKIAEFLLAQKSNSWSWNYWFRKSPEAKKFLCPDDLDCKQLVKKKKEDHIEHGW